MKIFPAMPDETLIKYIREGLAMGRTEDTLRALCANAGWPTADIDAVFVYLKAGSEGPAPQNHNAVPAGGVAALHIIDAASQSSPAASHGELSHSEYPSGAQGGAQNVPSTSTSSPVRSAAQFSASSGSQFPASSAAQQSASFSNAHGSGDFMKSVAQPSMQSTAQPAGAVRPSSQQSAQPAAQPLGEMHGSLGARPPKKKWPIAVAAIVVVAVIGGGGWATYAYFIEQPSPASVMAAMFGNKPINSTDQDLQFSIKAHITPNTSQSSAGFVSLAAAQTYPTAPSYGGPPQAFSPFSFSSPVDLELQGSVSGTYSMPSGKNVPDMDENWQADLSYSGSGSNLSFSGSGETKMVDNTVYVNLATFPNLGFVDLSSITGKWIRFSADSSTEALAQNTTGFSVPASLGSFTAVSPAEMGMIMDALKGAIQITKTLPTENVGGVDSYHYSYVIDKTGMENFLSTIESIAASSTASSGAPPSIGSLSSQNESIADILSAASGEVWIGKKDSYPHGVAFILEYSTSTPFGMVDATVNMTSTLSNINNGQVVSAPAQSESVEDLYPSMMQSVAPQVYNSSASSGPFTNQ